MWEQITGKIEGWGRKGAGAETVTRGLDLYQNCPLFCKLTCLA